MVAYSAPAPANMAEPTNGDGPAMVSREGWMLMRTAVRILLVAVNDPGQLMYLSQGDTSPMLLAKETQAIEDGPSVRVIEDDTSSEEEETPAQKKELRRLQKEMKKAKRAASKKNKRG